MDGSGYDKADAAARVEVRSTGVAPKTTSYGGWQAPDWNMTSPDQGITVDLSPEEDMAESSLKDIRALSKRGLNLKYIIIKKLKYFFKKTAVIFQRNIEAAICL